ncbi:dicarboxylate/amino acid:cation symporter [Tunturiibacter empetritectus]|uniref:Aerobic C4-dicarboxylate transport protein n=1 Tax=Tunturiibacter lichenicola TaxID=2051959 RepID=A0A852VNF3_9BACT|nr:dicarboxylate/amino acid:cation symporter [Edaphobacter lichenicola]NYF91106.1 aerobic C4-dicarboxylate transport protein [Edaphobacter lichenicola]
MRTEIEPDVPLRKPFYQSLSVQVTVAIVLGVALGRFAPQTAIAMKPLGDAFIKLIAMVITVVIFCTVVTGIAGMQDMKKVGRVGGKALLYFEVVSTLALFIGLVAGNLAHPGSGLNVNPATLDVKAVAEYSGAAKAQNTTQFLLHIIPTTMVDAFAKGDILQVVFISVLLGVALAMMHSRAEPLLRLLEVLTQAIFTIVNLFMRLAPIGAFGAMAFTVGRYGVMSLGPLLKLILTFYLTCALFVIIVLGAVSWLAGFNIFRFLRYIKEEILLVLGTSSSESALPSLMEKMERLGCSKALVGLVVPTGYTFNTDGSSLYITMAALFVAQATNTHLTIGQQLSLFAVAILTSKGASGVQGAGFVALVGTLIVVPTIPVAGMALILGIDRFLSTFRALVNMIGNGVGTIVVASWEHEIEGSALTQALAMPNNRTIEQQIMDQPRMDRQIRDQQISEGEEEHEPIG